MSRNKEKRGNREEAEKGKFGEQEHGKERHLIRTEKVERYMIRAGKGEAYVQKQRRKGT